MEEQTELQAIKEGEKTEGTPEKLGELEKLEKPRKKAKKRRRRKGVKITRFDKAVAELVAGGFQSASAIRDKLRVDPKQFDARLKTLLRAGFFALDEQNPDVIRFGIKGFNAFAGKPRKKTEKQSARQEALAVALSTPSTSSKPSVQQKLEERKEVEVDLSELLEKGAPKPSESFFVKRQKTRGVFEEIPVAATASELRQAIAKGREKAGERGEKTALLVEGKEVCELCKTGFKLAVSGGNPKYGYCFCGAAYHKDCYESLVDDSGKCVRCGKKLKLELDKKSAEAVKQIKDVFE